MVLQREPLSPREMGAGPARRQLGARPVQKATMTDPAEARPDAPAPTTHFGFSDVALDRKQGLVDDVFHKVAERYDVMNDAMSGGLHRVWKDVLVSMVKPSRRPRTHLP